MAFNPVSDARSAVNNTINGVIDQVNNILGNKSNTEAGRNNDNYYSFYDVTRNNPNASVIIIGSIYKGKSIPITGVISQDFVFNTSANWGGLNQDHNAKNYMSKLIEGWKGAMNRWNQTHFEQGILQWAGETVMKWEGTSPIAFNIPLIFVATRPDEDVLKNMILLQKGIFPTFESPSNPLISSMTAPNGYSVGDINNIQGRYQIKIGKWFSTPKLFIIDGVDFIISKEVTSFGRPLYVTGSVSFKSSRIMSFDEVQQMFIMSNI